MELLSYSKSASWRIALRYLVTLGLVLLVGAVLKQLPLIEGVKAGTWLSAAGLIDFFAKTAALILFFQFARHSIAAIPEDSGLFSFLRGIATPVAALVLIVMGQSVLGAVIHPVLGPISQSLFSWGSFIAVLGVGVWLILVGYRHSPYLVEAGIRLMRRFSPEKLAENACPDCGASHTSGQKFCGQCGAKFGASRNA